MHARRHGAFFRFRQKIRCLYVLSAILPPVTSALADAPQKRLALLIQNEIYPDAEPAQHAGDDASALAALLKNDGFEAQLERNVSRQQLRASVAAFVARTTPSSIALVYYKGIGIQVSRLNYLIPVDASIWSEDDVRRDGTSLDHLMTDLDKRGAGIKIAIVDAARPNPFERRFRMYAAGLAPLGTPKGSLAIFSEALDRAADPGKRAAGSFTAELVRQLDEATDVETAFARTRERVAKASNGRQLPWVSSTLADRVRLSRRETADLRPPPIASTDQGKPPVASQAAPVIHPPSAALKPPNAPPHGTPPTASADQGKPPGTTQAAPPVQPARPSPKPPAVQHDPSPQKPAEGTAGAAPSAPTSPQNAMPSSRPKPEVAGTPPELATPPAKPLPKPIQEGAAQLKPATPEIRPGGTFRDCRHCPEMTVLSAARFKMGSGTTAFDRPVHGVTFRKPFAIALAAVTRDEWALCVEAGGCASRPDTAGDGDHPVVDVTWFDAKQYVAFLSRTTGSTYRLPTEAEWEYAARGGTTTIFAWGDTPGTGHANCTDCGNKSGRPRTEPVKTYPKNGFGLFDMAGNVAEWLEDCWFSTYRDASSDGSAPPVEECKMRVVRGGSFETTSAYIKPTARFRHAADARSRSIGFRVARDLK